MLFVIACTGPSLTTDQLHAVRGLPLIAVNGVYQIAPLAYALVANDMAWWQANPDAHRFAGRKFSHSPVGGSVERIKSETGIVSGTCSGVAALEVAKMLGASKVILLGVDMHGSHFFGDYVNGLANTTEQRREYHSEQFAWWAKKEPQIEVVNCSPATRLDCFPTMNLADALERTGG